MKKANAAFTLIELLVVITIIAVLASIALPAYNGVKERGDQTKDLSNAKQIALALRQFAIDNNGVYPNKAPGGAGDYNSAPSVVPTTSNDAFWWLFPSYLQTEQIFAVPGSAYTPGNPDNVTDPAGSSTRTNTLKQGENAYAYVTGLTDTSNSTFPIIADGFVPASTPSNPVYDPSKSNKGGVWAAKKAVVVLCDSSGQLMKVDITNKWVTRTNSSNAQVNMFVGTADGTWIDSTANPVLNPQ